MVQKIWHSESTEPTTRCNNKEGPQACELKRIKLSFSLTGKDRIKCDELRTEEHTPKLKICGPFYATAGYVRQGR